MCFCWFSAFLFRRCDGWLGGSSPWCNYSMDFWPEKWSQALRNLQPFVLIKPWLLLFAGSNVRSLRFNGGFHVSPFPHHQSTVRIDAMKLPREKKKAGFTDEESESQMVKPLVMWKPVFFVWNSPMFHKYCYYFILFLHIMRLFVHMFRSSISVMNS